MTGLPSFINVSAMQTPSRAETHIGQLRVGEAMLKLEAQKAYFQGERFLRVSVKNLLRPIQQPEIFHRVGFLQSRSDLLGGGGKSRKREILIRVMRGQKPHIPQPPMQ